MAQYEGLARIYDALSEHDYVSWAEYVLQLAGNVRNVVDIGCGTGDIAIEFARKGKHVTAIDLSEAMLMEAMDKARKAGVKIEFSQQDMTRFTVHKPVELAMSNCDSINYIIEPTKLRSVFSAVNKALVSGGKFVFDILSPYRMEHVLGDSFYGYDSEEIAYIWQNSFDKKRKILKMDITFFVQDGENYKKVVETHRQRVYTTDEITEMLAEAGFEEITAFEAFTQNKPKEKSDRICFSAIKP